MEGTHCYIHMLSRQDICTGKLHCLWWLCDQNFTLANNTLSYTGYWGQLTVRQGTSLLKNTHLTAGRQSDLFLGRVMTGYTF